MNRVALVSRFFTVAAALLFWPVTSSAQMGMGGAHAGFGSGFFDPASRHSVDAISSGLPGATYTPFERLRYESRTTRKHAVQSSHTSQEGDDDVAGKPAAETIDTDEVDVHETAFRVRTERMFPQPSLTVATETFQPIYLSADSPRERRIRKKLDESAEMMEFSETSLREVAAKIEELHDIPIQIDARALEDAGLDWYGLLSHLVGDDTSSDDESDPFGDGSIATESDPQDDVPVSEVPDTNVTITRSVRNVSLRSALYLLLDDFDLTFVVTNDVLLITTKDKAAENLQVVLYPFTADHDLRSLADIVQNTVAPQTWNSVGGPGAIQPVGRFLCISQTEQVHYQVRQLLERLCDSEFLQVDGSEGSKPQRIVTRIHPVIDPEVLGELGVKLASLCNDALGADGDSAAKVFVIGKHVVVQSSCRAFHVYAADVVSALNGLEVTTVERIQGRLSAPRTTAGGGGSGMGSGAGTGGGMF